MPVEVINHAIRLGVDFIGGKPGPGAGDEKYDRLERDKCQVHFIGHLQTNKVKNLVGRVDMIQSVDSVRLAKEISRSFRAAGGQYPGFAGSEHRPGGK